MISEAPSEAEEGARGLYHDGYDTDHGKPLSSLLGMDLSDLLTALTGNGDVISGNDAANDIYDDSATLVTMDIMLTMADNDVPEEALDSSIAPGASASNDISKAQTDRSSTDAIKTDVSSRRLFASLQSGTDFGSSALPDRRDDAGSVSSDAIALQQVGPWRMEGPQRARVPGGGIDDAGPRGQEGPGRPGAGLPEPPKGNITTPWFRMQTDSDGNSKIDVGLSRLFPIVSVRSGGDSGQEEQGPEVQLRG